MSVWDDYAKLRVLTESPADLRHAGLVQLLTELHAINPQAIEVTKLGESVEGRAISQLTLGSGPTRILAWSQMHGDEPTHTEAMLTLVNLLQRFPEDRSAKSILAGCTLYLVPMLNPDGAERYTRRNAQDIDVNRDALHLQTPEGRLLKQAVETVRPHFALNLHNQRPRASVDAVAGQVAAVSLLVPPIDPECTETKTTRLAKQVAVCLIQAVKPYCAGMISRYPANFMPRCFGEWVQQQGVATLTIEAGGWSTPDLDSAPLEKLHFVGLASALEAIASEAYLQADPTEYDELPLSGEHDLFDLLLRGVTVANGERLATFFADLGINYSAPPGRRSPLGDGCIADLGDLRETSGKTLVDATELICVPGRIAYAPDILPSHLPSLERVGEFLATGVTTIIGQVDLANAEQLDALAALKRNLNLPVNLGIVGSANSLVKAQTTDILGRIISGIARGLLGLLVDGISEELALHLQSLQIPLLNEQELSVKKSESIALASLTQHTHDLAERLRLSDRGRIALGAVADLLLLRSSNSPIAKDVIFWKNLHQVMVAGTVVFDNDEIICSTGGVLLTSRLSAPTV